MVWMAPEAGGIRPELGLLPTTASAKACQEAVLQGLAAERAPGVGAGDALRRRGGAAVGGDGVRDACRGVVGLKHGTGVELQPPPGECGAGLAKVLVRDGVYRGRIGCVRADGLRVP